MTNKIAGYVCIIYSITCIVNLTYGPGLLNSFLFAVHVALFINGIDFIFGKEIKK